ncbi:MAG: hypothetical protein LBS35_02240 [Synergistaceae bacterium]|jgi:hypothetical protein|nr:hypothetical protein [Synergistaceae bacterium]
MALVTSNTQGELTPLEIGLHALECVEKAQGKRGGGLTEYAKMIGKSQPVVSRFRSAAEVYLQLHSISNEVNVFTDKTWHLFELHAAPRETWPLLAEALISCDWSVKDTHYYVEQVLRFFGRDDKEKRDARIFHMWMACFTQEEIAETVGCTKETVSEICQKQYRDTESDKPAANHLIDYEPPIYNIWKQQTKSTGSKHFGNSKR